MFVFARVGTFSPVLLFFIFKYSLSIAYIIADVCENEKEIFILSALLCFKKLIRQLIRSLLFRFKGIKDREIERKRERERKKEREKERERDASNKTRQKKKKNLFSMVCFLLHFIERYEAKIQYLKTFFGIIRQLSQLKVST